MAKTTKEDYIAGGLIMIGVSALLAAILEFIVYPILFILFHDCGKFMCSCSPDWSWTTYFICFTISLLFVLFVFAMSSASDASKRSSAKSHDVIGWSSRGSSSGSGRVTDYYDSDVEGAPGYFGGD